jgi:ATP-dependent exoDNAse (exonuclease V) beta subunit
MTAQHSTTPSLQLSSSPPAAPAFRVRFAASAGTGKTFQVTQLYLALVLGRPYPAQPGDLLALKPGAIHPGGAPVPCEQVLMLTFSRNAAAELRQRITAGIEQARAEAEASGQDELAARCWNLLHRLPAADISTIHAYAQRLVEQHALLLGHSPSFSVLDEDAASELRQEAFEGALCVALESDDEDERAALEQLCAGRSTADVLAALQTLLQSARSLGLRLEQMDVEALVEQPTPPTLARLRELRAQLATATGSSKRGKAPQILAALTQLLATATKATDLAALAAEVAELAKGAWGKGDPQLTAAREALKHFGAYAEHKLAAENLPPLLRLARRAAQDYEDAKREQAALDFDDLLLLARDLITQHSGVLPPSAALIVDEAQDNSALQNELILGLQAASGAALALCGDWKQTIYAWRNAEPDGMARLAGQCALHDVPLRQSFRSQQGVLDWVNDFCRRQLFNASYGADDELQPCPKALATEPPNIELLLPEWEARPHPLELVLKDQPRLTLTRRQIKKLAAAPEGDTFKAFPDSAKPVQGLEKETAPVSNPWKEVLARAEQSLALEARALARRIELLTAGPARAAAIGKIWRDGAWVEPLAPPYRRRDILLLLKATGRQEVYEAALRERGIPYTTDGKGRGFLTRQEVQDVASLLAWLAFPEDLVALLAVARSPFCALSDETLAVLAQGRSAQQLAAALNGAETAALVAQLQALGLAAEAPAFERAVKFCQRLRALAGRMSAVELAREAIRLTGFDATAAGSFHGAQRIANLKKLLSWIETRERSDGLDLAGVARWLRDEIAGDKGRPDAPVLDPQDDAVRINTVHAAKGLTSPVVCVPDLRRFQPVATDWLLPRVTADGVSIAAKLKTRLPDLPDAPELQTGDFETARAALKASREAEDGRLFYVAATRPRDLLIFSSENGHVGNTWRGALNKYLLADYKEAEELLTLVDYRAVEAAWQDAGLDKVKEAQQTGAISAAELAARAALPERKPLPERHRCGVTTLTNVPLQPTPEQAQKFLEELAGLDPAQAARGGTERSADSRAERQAAGRERHARLRDFDPARPPDFTDQQLAAAARWLQRTVKGLPPENMLRELPFAARFAHDGAEVFVAGAADLVFFRDGVWTIADYKFTDESPDELRRRYALQLAIYRAALFGDDGRPRFATATGKGEIRLLLVRCGGDFQALEIPLAAFPSLGKVSAEVIAAARALRKLQQG